MKKKSVLPFAAVLAIAAFWMMLTRGGRDQTMRVQSIPVGKTSSTSLVVLGDSGPIDEGRSERLDQLLNQMDARNVDIHAASCTELTCSVEASTSGDPALLRASMDSLLRENPWLGSRLETRSMEGQPQTITFIFHSETASTD